MEMQKTATVRVSGNTGTFVVRRADGCLLSLSGTDNGLTEWKGNTQIQNHGVVQDAMHLLHIVADFIGQEKTAPLPD